MILALHGNLGSPRDFDPLVEHGASNLRPVDLWPLAHLSLRDAAAALRDLGIEATGPRGLLGYSMGGRLALQSLADFPETWDFAIIISAHPGLVDEAEKSRRLEADREWARLVREMPWKEFLARWNAQPILEGALPPRQDHHSIVPSFHHSTVLAAAFENWSLGRQENLREKLAAFRKPVLWMAGKRDEKFAALATEMAALHPQIELRLLDGCGHRVLLERPEAVAEACRWASSIPDS